MFSVLTRERTLIVGLRTISKNAKQQPNPTTRLLRPSVMTDSTHLQPLSSLLTQLRTQSTIYRRHETRLARSFAVKGDERIPIIRVLSLLPLFSLFVPKYEPVVTAIEVLGKAPFTAESSDEYAFREIESEGCISIFVSQQQLDPVQRQSINTSTQVLNLPAICATATVAAISQTMLTLSQISAFNPFHDVFTTTPMRLSTMLTKNSHKTPAPLMGRIIARTSQKLLMMNVATLPQQLSALMPHVPLAAASVGLLFATRDILAPEHGFLVASAAAGVLASLPALMYQSHRRVIFAPTVLPLNLARHALGGMSYFGVYEYIRGGNDSIWQTAMAGYMAGVAGATLTAPTRTIWRAAPAHAIVWCVYEHVVASTTSTTRQNPSQDFVASHNNLNDQTNRY